MKPKAGATLPGSVLRFWTGQGWPQVHKPAWGFQCRVEGEENVNSGRSWEYGFIQTVEKLQWQADYSDGTTAKVPINFSDDSLLRWRWWALIRNLSSPARDCLTEKVRAPWVHDDPSQGTFPDSLFDPKVLLGPTLADEPAHDFHIVHPHAWAKCTRIEEVSAEGRFNIWVIVRDKDIQTPVLEKDITFLRWISVSFSKNWTLKNGSAENPMAWVSTGKQTKTEGAGRGKAVLVLENPTAPSLLSGQPSVQMGARCPQPVRTILARPR